MYELLFSGSVWTTVPLLPDVLEHTTWCGLALDLAGWEFERVCVFCLDTRVYPSLLSSTDDPPVTSEPLAACMRMGGWWVAELEVALSLIVTLFVAYRSRKMWGVFCLWPVWAAPAAAPWKWWTQLWFMSETFSGKVVLCAVVVAYRGDRYSTDTCYGVWDFGRLTVFQWQCCLFSANIDGRSFLLLTCCIISHFQFVCWCRKFCMKL